MAFLAARKSKTDAYTTAGKPLIHLFVYSHTRFAIAWVGAAPTGNRKRAASNVESTAQAQPPKKVKKGLFSLFLCFIPVLISL